MIPFLFAVAAGSGSAGKAAAAQVGSHAPSTPGLFGAFVALALVVALIFALAWLLRRLPGGGFRPAEGLTLVASLPLGAKERVVVVEVGGRQLLLGVTAGGIRTLHELPEPLPQAPAPKLPDLRQLPNFAQLLAQKLRKDR